MTRRWLLVGALALMVGLSGAVARVPASATSDTSTVGTATEAWHRAQPICALPIGCAPTAAPSPYPEWTLHVGVTGGQETDRTYLVLDLTSLPFDAELTGGTLTIPLAPDAGSQAPEAAALEACLVEEVVDPAPSGTTTAGPAPDCGVSSKATFVPGGARPSFTIDLAPFADAWAGSNHGLALVPSAGQSPTAAWHVGFDSKDRAGEAAPASAEITYERPAAPGSTATTAVLRPTPSTTTPAVEEEEVFEDIGVPFESGGVGPGLAPAPPPLSSGRVIAQAAPAAANRPPTLIETDLSFRYTVIFLLPLVLLVAGGGLAYGLTRPVLGEEEL